MALVKRVAVQGVQRVLRDGTPAQMNAAMEYWRPEMVEQLRRIHRSPFTDEQIDWSLKRRSDAPLPRADFLGDGLLQEFYGGSYEEYLYNFRPEHYWTFSARVVEKKRG